MICQLETDTDLNQDDVGGYRPASPVLTVSDWIVLHLDIFGPCSRAKLITAAEWHHFNERETVVALNRLLVTGAVRKAWGADLLLLRNQEHPAVGSVFDFVGRCWERATGPKVLVVAILAMVLLCVALTWSPKARGVEVPDRIIAGLVMVESGAEWRNIGNIKGSWARGADGEISHFQLTTSALRAMKVEHQAARIAADPVLAESYARAYLLICYRKRGNWPDALATYNKWSDYRSPRARDYARRVLNLASVL